jgi:hypothetical protein
MSYKVDGPSNRAMQFRFSGENDDFLLEAFKNSQVFLHTIEIDDRLHVMIEVGEDTTTEQLRKVIPDALRLRDKLIEFQGAWRAGGINEFLEHLSYRNQHGDSYARLAENINQRIEGYLRDYIAYRKEVDTVHPEFKAEHDRDILYHVFWLGMATKPSALSFAMSLLEGLNFNKQDALRIMQNGLRSLSAGESIFLKDYPVTRSKMIQVLRTWRNGKEHKSIIATE